MNKLVRKAAVAATVSVLALSPISKGFANENLEGAPVARASVSAVKPDLEKKDQKTSPIVVVGKAVMDEVKIEDVKGLFSGIKQKVQDELNDYQKKTGQAPSGWRKFWVGFKHGFIETVKAGVKLLVKIAPVIIAAI